MREGERLTFVAMKMMFKVRSVTLAAKWDLYERVGVPIVTMR